MGGVVGRSRGAMCHRRQDGPGKWKYFYNGRWDEPALGGKSCIVTPSHLWGVIYSTYLDKYICMFPSNKESLSR